MKNNIWLGSIFALISALFYSIQTSFVKYTMMNISLPILVFIQSLISLILILWFMYLMNRGDSFYKIFKSDIKTKHLARTIFSLGISYFLFASLKSIPFFDPI